MNRIGPPLRIWLALSACALFAANGTAAAPSLARLTTQVERAEGVRAIKRLQAAYAHYLQMGLWNEAAALFAREGELVWGDSVAKGPAAIAATYLKSMGSGVQGLAPGQLILVLDMAPVVTLSADGRSGKGRWHELSMEAHYRKDARWGGGIHENDYVLEDGVWKFARLHYYPLFAGPYKGGWRNVSADPKTVPYHYTADEAGVPSIALPEGAALSKAAPAAALAERIARLNDEAAVARLQNAYGYYVDRRMWDDVADLFAPGGTLEAAEGSRLTGRAAIRARLEAIAPAGLKPGELNDHLQLDVIVTVDPGGRRAHARGVDYGMVGRNGGDAYWTIAVFENDFVKRNGVWMVQAMRLYPRSKTDYYEGWAESALPDFPLAADDREGDTPPSSLRDATSPFRGGCMSQPRSSPERGGGAPKARRRGVSPAAESNRPIDTMCEPTSVAPASRLQYPAQGFPALGFRNPVTGRAPAYPASLQILPIDRPPAIAGPAPKTPGVAELERRLWTAAAYDGAENVSTAYGYFIDEFQWRELGQLFAKKGSKELSYIGTYVGRDRVTQSLYERYGKGDGRKGAYLAIHQKVQPVTTVAPDGKSAHSHMHLFQLGSAPDGPGAQIGGIYENKIVLEKGLWKIAAMDLDYVWTSSYADGWGKVDPAAAKQFAPKPGALAQYPPDRPLRGPSFAPYPAIEPILFHFRNPVSGRKPPLFLDE